MASSRFTPSSFPCVLIYSIRRNRNRNRKPQRTRAALECALYYHNHHDYHPPTLKAVPSPPEPILQTSHTQAATFLSLSLSLSVRTGTCCLCPPDRRQIQDGLLCLFHCIVFHSTGGTRRRYQQRTLWRNMVILLLFCERCLSRSLSLSLSLCCQVVFRPRAVGPFWQNAAWRGL